MRAVLTIVALAACLAGCSHQVYVVGRSTGATGATSVSGPGSSGPISIALGGKTFIGRWVYTPGGGGVGFTQAAATTGGQTISGTATTFSLPAGGPGSILASAPDGTSLRCSFQYSSWGGTGMGVCQDSAGEIYDLQIN